jgi:hypothetical protein
MRLHRWQDLRRSNREETMRIRIEDGETKLDPSCSSTTTLSCVTTRDGSVVVSVPKKGTFIVDVTVERVRAPLPEGAEWESDRSILVRNIHGNRSYGVNPDEGVWGTIHTDDDRRYIPVPQWALEAFRAEGLLKTEREEHPREPIDREWAWNRDIPPPVELPKGMRWCYDPRLDGNSWDVMSGESSIGYVRRRLGEEYWVMLRRAHGRFTLESLRHKSIDACRELARLVATATDLYHVEREERPPAPEPAEEWTWNRDIQPPVELSSEMRWLYSSRFDSWDIVAGPVSLGYVRRDSTGKFWMSYRNNYDESSNRYEESSNALDACRELARLVATATELRQPTGDDNESAGSSELPSLRHLDPMHEEALEGIHDIVVALREDLQQLSAAILDRCPEPKPARVEREERPPAPEPAEEWTWNAEEWTWNREVPPPVELPSAEMWWRYESVLGVWHVMSGNWPPVSLGYVRRDPSGHCFAFCRDKYAIHANAIDAFRELARVLRDRGRKGTEPCHEPGDELPSE